MAKTKYTEEFTLEPIYAGDSLEQFSLEIVDIDSDTGLEVEVIPSKVCCIFKSYMGKELHRYSPEIKVGGKVLFKRVPKEITIKWPAGVTRFDIEYTLPNGRVRTYLKGSIRILEGVGEC